jgi:tetraacyldisaccharide 4'-kinase
MQLLRKLLFPFSLIYAVVVSARNWCYEKGIFKSESYLTTTICVGNLSVGGTGKTPMTEYLIHSLIPRYKVAMLSRGYKRKSSGFVLASRTTTVEQIGDEPFQIFRKFPTITVAVDADRRNGISYLEQEIKPEVIVLDDAFQHRKVKPSYSILLTTYENLYVDDWYLPTGNLRDAKYAAQRANCIVVTKCPESLSKEEQARIVNKLKPKAHQTVLFAYLSYDDHVLVSDKQVPLSFFMEKELSLVTGIADPKPLASFLKRNGIDFEHLAYNDHHFFTKNEIAMLSKKKCILTTEKDYVRLKNDLDNLYYIPVSHAFLNNGAIVLQQELEKLMTR